MPVPEFADMQGLLRFGHRRLTEARLLLLRVADAEAARQWLASAPVTDAAGRDPRPDAALHVALTATGLAALGVPDDVVAGFSAEFIAGMAGDENRSRRLGDSGANDPALWRWGQPGAMPHVLAMIYATPTRFNAWWEEVAASAASRRAFTVVAMLSTTDLGGYEPFGFADGISQPTIDWEQSDDFSAPQLEYRNVSALGEFVLGYTNEYGRYTDRPLLDPAADPSGILPSAEDRPDLRDLGRNGSYLVLRDLAQDVSGFWRLLAEQQSLTGQSAQALAEAMVGRTVDGAPLVASSAWPISGVADGAGPENRFSFADDPDGVRCPLGAHIRRANPRNADMPGGPGGAVSRLIRTLGFDRHGVRDDLVASARFHRLLRRGRPYGPKPARESTAQGGAGDGSTAAEERGIRFICLNANISRQFEFVQNAWIASAKFDGLMEENDPLLGNREPSPGGGATDTFTYSRAGTVRRRVCGLPQFVTVRGGGYFFLPGIRALRYLASLGDSRRGEATST